MFFHGSFFMTKAERQKTKVCIEGIESIESIERLRAVCFKSLRPIRDSVDP